MNSVKSFLADYWTHVTGYVAGGFIVLSTLDPGAVPPKYALLIGIAKLVSTGIHNGFKAGAGNQAVTAAVAAATQALTAAKLVLAITILAPLALMLHGCGTLQAVSQGITKPSAAPYVQAAVDIAVGVAESKGITAVQINGVAHKVLAADQNTQATLDQLAAVANGEIVKLGLSPTELAAAEILEAALEVAINDQIQKNADAAPTLAQSQAAVALLMTDVINATGS